MNEPLQRHSGAHPATNAWHGDRSATVQAGFFLPLLKPGMRLLDLGAGLGNITLGLAGAVAPGEVVGIDVESRRVDQAQALARERGVNNVTFQMADAHNLPFPDASFDAVFANAVFEHLRDPDRAIWEVWRVLKPGGCVGLRDAEWDGWVWSHEDVQDAHAHAIRPFIFTRGSNFHLGKQLGGVLSRAGFGDVGMTASYEMYNTALGRAQMLRLWEGWIADPEFAVFHQARGQDVGVLKDQVLAAARPWAEDPLAFLAQSWFAAWGWKA